MLYYVHARYPTFMTMHMLREASGVEGHKTEHHQL